MKGGGPVWETMERSRDCSQVSRENGILTLGLIFFPPANYVEEIAQADEPEQEPEPEPEVAPPPPPPPPPPAAREPSPEPQDQGVTAIALYEYVSSEH